MKKPIPHIIRVCLTVPLFMFLELLPAVCDAQPYQSIFGEESSSWNVWMRYDTDSLAYIGDTVINGSEYKRVLRKSIFDTGSVYFLTEDTATGKVYYFTEDDPDQKLILDMSLSVGDSLFIASPYIYEYRPVDSVYYDSGRKHIRFDIPFHVHSQHEMFTFIEGIGSSFGLLYPEESLGPPVLLCAWQDKDQVYHDSLYDSCYAAGIWGGVTKKNADLSALKVYPNPAGHTLQVESKQHRIKSLKIYDLSGRLLLQHSVKPSQSGKETHTLNIYDLPRGAYIIQAVTDKGSKTKKFIKDRD